MNYPKKSLGQHWLEDGRTLNEICNLAEIKEGDEVLEIGPGKGSLTKVLLARGAKVIAVEKDETLATALPLRLGQIAPLASGNLQIIEGDILKFDFSSLPKNYKVVANIPYYLTSNLLKTLCESPNTFSSAVLLVQKEVAERVVSGPGEMSILSISVQFYCDVGLGPIVPAEMFLPPPKVDSQVVVLSYGGPKYSDISTNDFFQVVKAGFSEKRKKLRSSLSGGLGINKAAAEKVLQKAGVDPNRRAQELSLDEWHKICLAYAQGG